MVTSDFPLRRQPCGPVSGRAVYVCWLFFLEAIVRQLTGVFYRLEGIVTVNSLCGTRD